MATAARVTRKKENVFEEEFEQPTCLNVNLKKFNIIDKEEIGSKVNINVKGYVKSIHKDEYGYSATLEIDKIEKQ